MSGTVQGPSNMTPSVAMAKVYIGNFSKGLPEFNRDTREKADSSGSDVHRLI